MSTKMMTFSSLAALALSVSLLTACGSESKEPTGFAPKTNQTTPAKSETAPSSTDKSTSTSGSATSRKSVPASSAKVSNSTPVSSGQTNSSTSTVSEFSAAVASQTVPPASNQETSDDKATSTTASSEALAVRHDLKPVSPGAAAGSWSGIGKLNGDGTFDGSNLLVIGVASQQSGILHLDAITEGGYGFYMHYYPAGIKIPFEQFEDPTDTSRDRIIKGNSHYLTISKEQFEDSYLKEVAYRE